MAVFNLNNLSNNFTSPDLFLNWHDFINAFGGNDTVDGGFGNDVINGGNGRDILYGGLGVDNLIGGADGDVLVGGAGGDILNGGTGIDRAAYNWAPTGVRADLSNPGFNSGEATGDTYFSIENMSGSRFGDSLYGNSGNNTIWGERGNDRIYGRSGNDVLNGGSGSDRLYGGSGNDSLVGRQGNDYLSGGTGNDRIAGDSGNDTLVGGRGADRLTGGSGEDVFRFFRTSDSPFGNSNNYDVITDFQGAGPNFNWVTEDRIDLSAVDAGVMAFGNGPGAHRVWLEDVRGETWVRISNDNDAGIEMTIRLQDGATTAGDYWAGDFIL